MIELAKDVRNQLCSLLLVRRSNKSVMFRWQRTRLVERIDIQPVSAFDC